MVTKGKLKSKRYAVSCSRHHTHRSTLKDEYSNENKKSNDNAQIQIHKHRSNKLLII